MPQLPLTILAGLMVAAATAIPAYADDPTYEGATFVLGHDGPDVLPPGTAVNEVLTATDSTGVPIAGLPVRFERTGPGNDQSESCAVDELQACPVTDATGMAGYEFAGWSTGTAEVMASVYTPEGVLIEVVGPDTVTFTMGGCAPPKGAGSTALGKTTCITAKLSGEDRGDRDRLLVRYARAAEGARVKLQKRVAGEWKQLGPAETLNSRGDRTFKVKDRNGTKTSTYRAKILPTATTRRDTTNVLRLR